MSRDEDPAARFPKDGEILNLEEACTLLRVSSKTLAKALRVEDIPARKIGREWKFSRQALIAWVGSGKARDYARQEEAAEKAGEAPSLKAPSRAEPYSLPAHRSAHRVRGRDTFSVDED